LALASLTRSLAYALACAYFDDIVSCPRDGHDRVVREVHVEVIYPFGVVVAATPHWCRHVVIVVALEQELATVICSV
jgi:hypothetical protein